MFLSEIRRSVLDLFAVLPLAILSYARPRRLGAPHQERLRAGTTCRLERSLWYLDRRIRIEVPRSWAEELVRFQRTVIAKAASAKGRATTSPTLLNPRVTCSDCKGGL